LTFPCVRTSKLQSLYQLYQLDGNNAEHWNRLRPGKGSLGKTAVLASL